MMMEACVVQQSLLSQDTFSNFTLRNQTVTESAAYMYDGCALLHRIAWPKMGTISAVCDSFTSAVSEGHIEVVWVIFDTYDTVSTKDPELKRRRLKLQQCADIDVTHSTPVPSDKRSFLSNKKNKQKVINLLSQHLANKGYLWNRQEVKAMQM